MDVFVGDVFEGEFPGTRPQIAVLVPVALQVAIDAAHHGEGPDVELAVLIKKGPFDVLLDYVRSLVAIHVGVLYYAFDVVELFTHGDTASSVGILSWLHYPKVLSKLRIILKHSFFASDCIIVELLKLLELWIVEALLDVEGERHLLVVLTAYSFIVDLHVVEESLLVTQVVVVLHFAVGKQLVRCVVLLLLFFLALLAFNLQSAIL